VNTVAKAKDDVERQVDNKKLLDRTKAGIPGLRQTLPAKINQTTGEEIKGEGFWSNMLFGSRVKTANESALVEEISRLEKAGFAPTIADIERSSEQVKELKEQLGGRYTDAVKYYGKMYGELASEAVAMPEYKELDDESKQKWLNKLRGIARKSMLAEFEYEPKPKNKGLKTSK
jgi:hypothetical protein